MPTPWTADWTALVAKLKKKPLILTIHNDMDKPGFFGKFVTWVYLHTFFQLTLYFADKVIIVNPEWRTAFKKTRKIFERISAKVITIPNGVDINLFHPGVKKNKDNIILFVSILDEHHRFKGFEYLLSAMSQIKASVPDVKLVVVGEGSLVDEYKEKAKKLGISNIVEFHGGKTQAELINYYQSAKVFVLPSIEIEGFGIVLLEAMASGVPVVTTDVAGVASQIREYKTGLVVERGNSKKITEAVVAILNNNKEQEAMSLRGRKLMEERYSWFTAAKILSSVFEENYNAKHKF